MLYEMAIADAYGIGFEFVKLEDAATNDMLSYKQHPSYSDMKPGHYSDDTQRSIANALMVINGGHESGDIYNPVAYAKAYQEIFARDPRPGYSRRYEQYLRDSSDKAPIEFLTGLKRRSSNGAVMGAAPLGFLHTPEQIMVAAAAQAISTHNPDTALYAQIVALSAHYFIYQCGPASELINFLHEYVDDLGKVGYPIPHKTTIHAHSPVKNMLAMVPTNWNLSMLIDGSVSLGGDTDSCAAICVAVASHSEEYFNDIPKALANGLEDGQYGASYLKQVDIQLEQYASKAG